jgi:hypothetical protein
MMDLWHAMQLEIGALKPKHLLEQHIWILKREVSCQNIRHLDYGADFNCGWSDWNIQTDDLNVRILASWSLTSDRPYLSDS